MDWLGTLVANVIGMLLGFTVVRDIFFAYVGWTWLMIPWLWIRTRNPVFAIYALFVNLAFFIALIPEIRRYLEARKRGPVDTQQGMEVTPMGRQMLKMARHAGFLQGEEKLMSLLIDLQRQKPPASSREQGTEPVPALQVREKDPADICMSLGGISTIPGKRRFTGGGSYAGNWRETCPQRNRMLFALRQTSKTAWIAHLPDSSNRSSMYAEVDAILQAVWSIWGTAQSPTVTAYLERQNIASQQLFMAVIIQEMVPAKCSGVALSRNPVTGADEVVVESVQGLGDELVQGGVTPQLLG